MNREISFMLNANHTNFFLLLKKYNGKKKSILQLARKGHITKQSAYMIIDKLEDKGLIYTEFFKNGKTTTLTDRGEEAIQLISKLKFILI